MILVISLIGICKLIHTSNNPMAITKNFYYIEPLDSFFRRKTVSSEVKDWNNYDLMKRERSRIGFGEHGLKTYNDGEPFEVEERLIQENGHNALISDKISLDRAVPDLRSVKSAHYINVNTSKLNQFCFLDARKNFSERNCHQFQ